MSTRVGRGLVVQMLDGQLLIQTHSMIRSNVNVNSHNDISQMCLLDKIEALSELHGSSKLVQYFLQMKKVHDTSLAGCTDSTKC
jgi:hypothetical protein